MEGTRFSQRNMDPGRVRHFIKFLGKCELPEKRERRSAIRTEKTKKGLNYIEFEILKKQMEAALRANVDFNDMLGKDQRELKDLKKKVVKLETCVDSESKEERAKSLKEIERRVSLLEEDYNQLLLTGKHSEEDLQIIEERIDNAKNIIEKKKKDL
jgi:hypothetical protein